MYVLLLVVLCFVFWHALPMRRKHGASVPFPGWLLAVVVCFGVWSSHTFVGCLRGVDAAPVVATRGWKWRPRTLSSRSDDCIHTYIRFRRLGCCRSSCCLVCAEGGVVGEIGTMISKMHRLCSIFNRGVVLILGCVLRFTRSCKASSGKDVGFCASNCRKEKES